MKDVEKGVGELGGDDKDWTGVIEVCKQTNTEQSKYLSDAVCN